MVSILQRFPSWLRNETISWFSFYAGEMYNFVLIAIFKMNYRTLTHEYDSQRWLGNKSLKYSPCARPLELCVCCSSSSFVAFVVFVEMEMVMKTKIK